MIIFFKALFLFFISLIFALWEIEIEGKNGWAKKLPTWSKKTGFSKIYSFFASKKPLTGYHLFMLIFMISVFHIGFFLGLNWNLINELNVLLWIFMFIFVEDFLWFEFNPYYGLKNFKKNKI